MVICETPSVGTRVSIVLSVIPECCYRGSRLQGPRASGCTVKCVCPGFPPTACGNDRKQEKYSFYETIINRNHLQIFPRLRMLTKTRVGLGTLFIVLLMAGSGQECSAAVQGEAGYQVSFLFDNLSWLLFAAAFTGILGGAYTERTDPYIDNDRVWRHDFAAKFSHWTHAGGCVLLLISGVGLGFFFLPRLLPDASGVSRLMDLHFLGALFFVFGGFFWAANTILSPYRFTEHMPDRGSLIEGITHYAHIFKLTSKRVRHYEIRRLGCHYRHR